MGLTRLLDLTCLRWMACSNPEGGRAVPKIGTIILTAFDEPENESKGLKRGRHIRKPIHESAESKN